MTTTNIALLLAADTKVNLNLALPGVIAIVVGVAILLRPALLSYLVAAYLIAVGIIQVFNLHV